MLIPLLAHAGRPAQPHDLWSAWNLAPLQHAAGCSRRRPRSRARPVRLPQPPAVGLRHPRGVPPATGCRRRRGCHPTHVHREPRRRPGADGGAVRRAGALVRARAGAHVTDVAVVTGASRGIGRAVCVALARAGATVVATARSAAALQEVVAEVEREGGTGLAVECDVTDDHAVAAMAERAVDTFGDVDVLVNNAGACLALETARAGIRVNAICPGFVETELIGPEDQERLGAALHLATAEVIPAILSRVPVGRFVTPEEVAAMAVYLTSPAADAVTGQAFNVDGGLVLV